MLDITLRDRLTMENGPGLKTHLLLKMGIFQAAMFVYQRVSENPVFFLIVWSGWNLLQCHAPPPKNQLLRTAFPDNSFWNVFPQWWLQQTSVTDRDTWVGGSQRPDSETSKKWLEAASPFRKVWYPVANWWRHTFLIEIDRLNSNLARNKRTYDQKSISCGFGKSNILLIFTLLHGWLAYSRQWLTSTGTLRGAQRCQLVWYCTENHAT